MLQKISPEQGSCLKWRTGRKILLIRYIKKSGGLNNKRATGFADCPLWTLLGTIQRPSDYESDALTN